MKETISKLIPIKVIRTWNDGEIVTISAPTGKGKSHFIKNSVYLVAAERNQKILFLVHRQRCKQQFYNELKKDKKLDTIDVITYQTIESNKDFDFTKYAFIVCDEFHYFTSDSNFNYKTDISLEKILEQTDKIRIFMSATGTLMKKYINNIRHIGTIDYEIEQDFSWMNLSFFDKKSNSINVILDEVIENNKRALIFMDNAERSYNLYKEYKKNSLFCCSKNNKYYKYVDEEVIEKMLDNTYFSENLLITTNCLDAGVNIKDDNIKTIVCSIRDVGVLIQCLGRKRRNDNEKVNVYIENINNNVLGSEKANLNKANNMVRDFEEMTIEQWTEKYSKENNKYYGTLLYDVGNVKKINELMKFKILERTVIIELMVGNEESKIRGIGYKKYLANNVFNVPCKSYETYYEDIELEEYLDSIVGIKIFKENQKEFKEIFAKCGLKARSLGINTLNGYLKDRKLPFIIDSPERKSYRENGKVKKEKSHWMVLKLVSNLEN